MIQSNVIKAAHDFKVKKLLFLGSTLHLSEACASADQGGIFVNRFPGTDK